MKSWTTENGFWSDDIIWGMEWRLGEFGKNLRIIENRWTKFYLTNFWKINVKEITYHFIATQFLSSSTFTTYTANNKQITTHSQLNNKQTRIWMSIWMIIIPLKSTSQSTQIFKSKSKSVPENNNKYKIKMVTTT